MLQLFSYQTGMVVLHSGLLDLSQKMQWPAVSSFNVAAPTFILQLSSLTIQFIELDILNNWISCYYYDTASVTIYVYFSASCNDSEAHLMGDDFKY